MTALSPDAVMRRFELVSGYDKERISRYAVMILDCVDSFTSRLPDDADYNEAEIRRLCHACAVYAYYRVSLCCDDERVTSFKAGDVQYGLENGSSRARLMWEQERLDLTDLVDLCGDFYFGQVRA